MEDYYKMFFSLYIAPIMNMIQYPLALDTWTDVAYCALTFVMPLWIYHRISRRQIAWYYYVIFGFLGLISMATANFYLATAIGILLLYFVAFRRSIQFNQLATGVIMSLALTRLFITFFSLLFRLGITMPFHLDQRLGTDPYIEVLDVYYCVLMLGLLPFLVKKITPTLRRYLEVVVPTFPTLAWLGNIILLTYTIIRYAQSYRTILIPWGIYCLIYACYAIFYWAFMKIATNYTLMKMKVENQKVELNNLRIYTSHIEELYDDLRRFRHDYKNVLYSLTGALNNRDIDQAQVILDRVIKPSEENVNMRTAVLGRLANIQDLDVKSLIYSKIMDAMKQNIDFQVEVERPCKFGKTMEELDIVRVIAILLDNAIHGAAQAKEKQVRFSLFEKDQLQYLVVENSTRQEALNIQLMENNVNRINLGSNHGLGLKNLRMILARYPEVIKEESAHDYRFTQTIIIPQ